jgi:predicted  nucleic acid-binding Zn-ribbon protein
LQVEQELKLKLIDYRRQLNDIQTGIATSTDRVEAVDDEHNVGQHKQMTDEQEQSNSTIAELNQQIVELKQQIKALVDTARKFKRSGK